MCRFFQKRRQARLEIEKLGDRLWTHIGYFNLSRDAPREMVSFQNLSKVPDWMLRKRSQVETISQPTTLTFSEDLANEYKFVPRGLLLDVHQRPTNWKTIFKLEMRYIKAKH